MSGEGGSPTPAVQPDSHGDSPCPDSQEGGEKSLSLSFSLQGKTFLAVLFIKCVTGGKKDVREEGLRLGSSSFDSTAVVVKMESRSQWHLPHTPAYCKDKFSCPIQDCYMTSWMH